MTNHRNRSAARRAARQAGRHAREVERRQLVLARLKARHGHASFVWERGRIVDEFPFGRPLDLEAVFPHAVADADWAVKVGLAEPEDFFVWADLVWAGFASMPVESTGSTVVVGERMLVHCACEHIREEVLDDIAAAVTDPVEMREQMDRLPTAWLMWATAPTVRKSYGILTP